MEDWGGGRLLGGGDKEKRMRVGGGWGPPHQISSLCRDSLQVVLVSVCGAGAAALPHMQPPQPLYP